MARFGQGRGILGSDGEEGSGWGRRKRSWGRCRRPPGQCCKTTLPRYALTSLARSAVAKAAVVDGEPHHRLTRTTVPDPEVHFSGCHASTWSERFLLGTHVVLGMIADRGAKDIRPVALNCQFLGTWSYFCYLCFLFAWFH